MCLSFCQKFADVQFILKKILLSSRVPSKKGLYIDHLLFINIVYVSIHRGGRNALMLLPEDDRKEGVITASAGNHALALAWHGKDLGIPVICVMPKSAPMTKVEKCRKFGAHVILHGDHIGEAKEFAQSEYGHLRYINGYDDPEIIAGAGTMGIEILEQVPDVDVILVPVGGAGLIAGKTHTSILVCIIIFLG